MTLDTQRIEQALSVLDAKGRLVIAPCYSASFCSRGRGPALLAELLTSAAEVLGDRLTHITYRYGENLRAWDAEKFAERVATWTGRPRAGKTYWVGAIGGIQEASTAELTAVMDLLPLERRKPLAATELGELEAMVAKAVASGEMAADVGAKYLQDMRERIAAPQPRSLSDCLVHVCLPLALFPDPHDFRRWLTERAVASSDMLVAAHGGMALNWFVPHDEPDDGARRIGGRLAGMLLQQPALDWEDTGLGVRRANRPYEPADGFGDCHAFKRARWLNVISSELVAQVGGEIVLRKACEGHPGCAFELLGKNALITAGESPDPVGERGEQLVEALRHVNRLLRPVQVTKYGKPYRAPKDFVASFLSLGER